MNDPRVSVVIPLFNKGPYIRRAIDSVLAQTCRDFEIVVVNDGSTDGGPEIVGRIRDARVRLVNQDNGGVSAARNRGIRETKSELIGFLDADDEWLPEFLQTVIALAERYPHAGAYATGYLLLKGGARICREMTVKDGREKCGCYFDLLRGGADVWTSSNIVVRRAVFDKVGVFRVGHALAEDLDMWFRIGLHYLFACSARTCAVYHYDQPDNASHVAVPGDVSPLYLSLVDLEKTADIDSVVEQKAIEYLSRQLAKDIEYLLYRGFRDVARRRLDVYRRHYGVTAGYVRLCMLTSLPWFLVGSVTRLRLMSVWCMLRLKSGLRPARLPRPPRGNTPVQQASI
jgi:glycosyltransferase involved in cell wall biosynthesis